MKPAGRSARSCCSSRVTSVVVERCWRSRFFFELHMHYIWSRDRKSFGTEREVFLSLEVFGRER